MYIISEEEKSYYKYLDEKHKRLYAGLLATRIGRGGIKTVSEAFCMNRNTVSSGKKELVKLSPITDKKIRRAGGGAKKN